MDLVEAQMHVYRNDVLDLNEAPSMPTGLTATVQSENSVTFPGFPPLMTILQLQR